MEVAVCACVLSHFSCVRLFVTPWTVWPTRLLCPGQEYERGSPCPPPGDLPNPEIEPTSLALLEDSLPLSHQRSLKLLWGRLKESKLQCQCL